MEWALAKEPAESAQRQSRVQTQGEYQVTGCRQALMSSAQQDLALKR